MLLVFFGITFAVAAAGGRFTAEAIPVWYAGLQKPPLTPPSWSFGVVWGVLYAAMSVSVWLVWVQRHTHRVGIPLTLYFLQLALNLLWSIVFFTLRSPGWALVEIIVLLFFIVATALVFKMVNRVSYLLFVPYFLWVLFASYLNAGFWWLNR